MRSHSSLPMSACWSVVVLALVFQRSQAFMPSASTTLHRAHGARTLQVTGLTAHTLGVGPTSPDKDILCLQCEQTRHGKGCMPDKHQSVGVCGKTAETSAMQDLLVHYLMGIAQYAHAARSAAGLKDTEVDRFMLAKLFSTLTNVNFDSMKFVEYLHEAQDMKERAKHLYEQAVSISPHTLAYRVPTSAGTPARMDLSSIQGKLGALEAVGHMVGVKARKLDCPSEEVWSLGELVLYGLKGLAAYADHALILGKDDEQVYAFVHEALSTLADEKHQSVESMLALALKVGEVNLKAMELLDAGGTGSYGHPVPTVVRTSPVRGKCIAVSGHDLRDLEEVLKRTEGKGINVYTHGELLPAHGYPGLKQRYPHLVGNYGGPWQMQKAEFAKFPGPIVFTTNCLIEPQKTYKDRIYTRGVVGWPGVRHLNTWDSFDQVVEHAMSLPGFTDDAPEASTTTGFARNSVLGMADKIIDAVKSGDIKQFYVIGGCDGAEANRTYYRDIALGLPKDSVVLTLGCGKYRFNKEPFETTVGGLPRLLDVGQCNDAYSAIKIATALATALETDVNSLPLNFVISWFEQKAVAVLLTMLHLGITNIRIGPQLPAFVTPSMLDVLVKTYGLRQVGLVNHDADLRDMLAKAPR